jgi:hypothetical protein
MPTQAQFTTWIQTTLGFIAGWAAGKGYGDANLWAGITSIVVAAVPLVWGFISNTKLAQVKQAAALPEVAAVVIKSSATNGVAAAAADPTQPKIKAQ